MGYNMKSMKAEEFINDEEILESLAYAKKNKDNQSLINEILEKAKKAKGISHKEAAVLMECDIPEVNEQIKELAKEIKQKFYGNRIVMFAPLYLSNYCVNGCTYCPYHYKNKHIARKKLSQEDIRKEVIALQDMGHKRLALEAGEDPEAFTRQILVNPPAVITLDEVGCGIVPMEKSERDYREAVGHAGQMLAAAAAEVYRMQCGIAVRIK